MAQATSELTGAAIRGAPRTVSADWCIAGVLLVGTALLYGRTVGFDFVNFDDFQYFANNAFLRLGLSWAGIRWAFTASNPYWHPLTWLVYLTVAQLGGRGPGVAHGVNAGIHAVSAALLFLFLRRATGFRWRCAIAAAIWAWHPLRVESVAWISETKDVLAALFWMLTLLAYLRYVRKSGAANYALVTVIYLLDLAAKPTVVTLPLNLLLLDYWPFERFGRDVGRVVLEKIPWLAMAGTISAVAYRNQKVGGALSLDKIIPLTIRLENALISFMLYLWHTVWPAGLAIFYPHPFTIGRTIPWWQWGGSLLILSTITLAVFAWRKRQPAALVGWLWFIGTLVPMIGIVQAGTQGWADRHSLIPSIGLVVALVWIFASLMRFKPGLAGVLAACILLVELSLTWRQIGFWRNSETVFAHADAVTDENYLAKSMLAEEYAADKERWPAALALAQAADAICPHVIFPHQALAIVYDAEGKYHEALREYHRAVQIEPNNWLIRADLGDLMVKMNRTQDAIARYNEAIDLAPEQIQPRHNLAICLAFSGKLDEAFAQWQRIVREVPQFGPAQGRLAEILQQRGDRAGAVEHFRAAIADGEHNPAWEQNLAWLVATDPSSTSQQAQDVVAIARDACDRTGNSDPLALDALAAALARCGRYDDAVAAANRAIDRANAMHQPQLAKAIESRKMDYTAGRPYLWNN